MSAFFSNLAYVTFRILASKIKNKKDMSAEFRRKYRKTHIKCLYHFSLPSVPWLRCAQLYLRPRLEAIKFISVPRLSGNYLNKKSFLEIFPRGRALESNLTGRCPFFKSLHPFREKICILIPCSEFLD